MKSGATEDKHKSYTGLKIARKFHLAPRIGLSGGYFCIYSVFHRIDFCISNSSDKIKTKDMTEKAEYKNTGKARKRITTTFKPTVYLLSLFPFNLFTHVFALPCRLCSCSVFLTYTFVSFPHADSVLGTASHIKSFLEIHLLSQKLASECWDSVSPSPEIHFSISPLPNSTEMPSGCSSSRQLYGIIID